jgi:uncharacterized Tic20 family protein
MMNPLSTQVRLLATLCHLSGLTWVAAFAIMVQLQSMTELQNRLLPLLLVSTILLPILIWIFTRGVHNFIDRNGREVVNTMLSLLLYSMCLLFSAWIVCGVYPSLGILVAIPLFTVPFVMIIHVLASLVAILQALQGNFFTYPFIIRFMPNPS